ncbi:MAG: prepilin peptidase [Oligoflexia bacterium]|nr:prepilin peptidase [Oligoflexia bacterium]
MPIEHGIQQGWPFAALAAGCAAAAGLDLLRGRIPNALVVPFFAAGLAVSALHGGWAAVGDGLLGAGLGLVLYGWMFGLGFMGGGDVKFLMALGGWGGWAYASEVALFAILLGGALAVPLLLFKGKFAAFVGKLRRFLLSVFVRELELELPKLDRTQTMPYGVPIAVAAVWSAGWHPLGGILAEFGVRPWF